jgi:hypothetical protein
LRADPSSSQQLINVEQFCDACLQWAKHPIKDTANKARSGPYKIPDDMSILKLRDVHVPVLTINTPVDPTLQYQNCIWLTHYEKMYETAGGVNIPKICYCRGSDGVKYKQLVSMHVFHYSDETEEPHDSSRAREMTTCDKMPSWNRSSTLSTQSYVAIAKLGGAISAFEVTRLSH